MKKTWTVMELFSDSNFKVAYIVSFMSMTAMMGVFVHFAEGKLFEFALRSIRYPLAGILFGGLLLILWKCSRFGRGKSNSGRCLYGLGISEKEFLQQQTYSNGLFLLIYWGFCAGGMWYLMQFYAADWPGITNTPAFFLASSRSAFVGSLLPAGNLIIWIRNLFFIAGLSFLASVRSLRLRYGKGKICLPLLLAVLVTVGGFSFLWSSSDEKNMLYSVAETGALLLTVLWGAAQAKKIIETDSPESGVNAANYRSLQKFGRNAEREDGAEIPLLEVQHLDCSFDGRPALTDVNLEFGPGEIAVIFGENAAGKTTLLRGIAGFVSCEGRVLISDKLRNLYNMPRLAFVLEERSFFPGLSPAEHKMFYKGGCPRFQEKRYDALMDFFGLPKGKALRKFTPAQQTQYQLVLALSQGADCIFIDDVLPEDGSFRREDYYKLLELTLQPDETLVLATSRIDAIPDFVNRVIMLRHGYLIGDAKLSDMKKEDLTPAKYIKTNYNYRAEKASMERALAREEAEV